MCLIIMCLLAGWGGPHSYREQSVTEHKASLPHSECIYILMMSFAVALLESQACWCSWCISAHVDQIENSNWKLKLLSIFSQTMDTTVINCRAPAAAESQHVCPPSCSLWQAGCSGSIWWLLAPTWSPPALILKKLISCKISGMISNTGGVC